MRCFQASCRSAEGRWSKWFCRRHAVFRPWRPRRPHRRLNARSVRRWNSTRIAGRRRRWRSPISSRRPRAACSADLRGSLLLTGRGSSRIHFSFTGRGLSRIHSVLRDADFRGSSSVHGTRISRIRFRSRDADFRGSSRSRDADFADPLPFTGRGFSRIRFRSRDADSRGSASVHGTRILADPLQFTGTRIPADSLPFTGRSLSRIPTDPFGVERRGHQLMVKRICGDPRPVTEIRGDPRPVKMKPAAIRVP